MMGRDSAPALCEQLPEERGLAGTTHAYHRVRLARDRRQADVAQGQGRGRVGNQSSIELVDQNLMQSHDKDSMSLMCPYYKDR